jgi:hypothetical protein
MKQVPILSGALEDDELNSNHKPMVRPSKLVSIATRGGLTIVIQRGRCALKVGSHIKDRPEGSISSFMLAESHTGRLCVNIPSERQSAVC